MLSSGVYFAARQEKDRQAVFFSFWTRRALDQDVWHFFFHKIVRKNLQIQKIVQTTLQKMKNHKRIRSIGNAVHFMKWLQK